jgi:hypothetical protein
MYPEQLGLVLLSLAVIAFGVWAVIEALTT